MNYNKNILPYASATTTSIIFGLSFLFSKKALDIASPFSLLSFRFLTAFTIMSLLIIFKVITVNYKNKSIKNLFFLALMQPVIYFIFETYGIKNSSSSFAGIMIALVPIIVTVLASYFLKEKFSITQLAFIILSVIGVSFIAFMDTKGSGNTSSLGVILLIITVMSAAIFNILSRKLSSSFTPIEITYFMMGLGALFFNIVSISEHLILGTLENYFLPLKSKDFIISIFYLGIISSVIAFLLLNFTLSKIEASKSTVFSNLSTIVSIAAGVIVLNEGFKYYHIVGSIMILVGVWGTSKFGNSNKKIIPKEIELL
ncbi:DMT family transporter [Clostridium thailandense]|uniref:DMT family transporter n=1 Tax=Clostridium thailandense TaxID=2794346 RepID=A0A949X3U6_9CLOT|nr:DMT family transporter [Clostridium thailandense]MBV7272943.1 DMT family transporter [Clostridium thailandense]MCH5136246.1 DMT family transporter [Clostridiaceae bacterium UIB06]